jgi:hypothetical protein
LREIPPCTRGARDGENIQVFNGDSNQGLATIFVCCARRRQQVSLCGADIGAVDAVLIWRLQPLRGLRAKELKEDFSCQK